MSRFPPSQPTARLPSQHTKGKIFFSRLWFFCNAAAAAHFFSAGAALRPFRFRPVREENWRHNQRCA
jgi:hypothetical protein